MINILRNEVKNKQIYRCTDIRYSEKEYFIKVVQIFSSAFLDSKFHLTERELDLLYGVYQAISSGEREILKPDIISKYFSSFKDKKTVQVWLPRVEKKGWISESKGRYFIEGDFEKIANFNITGFTIDLIKNEIS